MDNDRNYDKRIENLKGLGVPPSIIDEVERAGRNSTLQIYKYDAPGSLAIYFGRPTEAGASIAKEHLGLVLSSTGHKFHHLDVVKHIDTLVIDSQFCTAIHCGLKNLKELEISFLKNWSSGEVDDLLKHMPTGISKLNLFRPDQTFSPSAQQIPLLLPQLRELEFHSCCHNENISQLLKEWAAVIEHLPSLETLVFKSIQSKEDYWMPVLLAIQAHPSLTAVHFKEIYDDTNHRAIKFGKEMQDSILCRLAINKAKAQLKLEDTDNDGPTLKNWANTVIASRHHVGCLDYLLSTFDPSLYAPAAIKGLQGPAYKRKREQAFGSEKGAEDRQRELKRQRELVEEERAEVFRWPFEEESDNDSDESDSDDSDEDDSDDNGDY